MTKLVLSGIKRNVMFATLTPSGEVAVMDDSTAVQRVYGSLEEFNRVRYRMVVASTEHTARDLKTLYYVFPLVAWSPRLCTFRTPTDFTFALFKTGVATPLEETLAAKHAALRFNVVNKING